MYHTRTDESYRIESKFGIIILLHMMDRTVQGRCECVSDTRENEHKRGKKKKTPASDATESESQTSEVSP